MVDPRSPGDAPLRLRWGRRDRTPRAGGGREHPAPGCRGALGLRGRPGRSPGGRGMGGTVPEMTRPPMPVAATPAEATAARRADVVTAVRTVAAAGLGG